MMTNNSDRRRLLQLALATIPAFLAVNKVNSAFAEDAAKPAVGGAGSQHDFDFFLGTWNVQHRRLKQALSGSQEWQEFDGSTTCQSLLGGIVNLNDSVINRPSGVSRGMGFRAYDAKTNTWADWYLDGRKATHLDAPGIGRFKNRIGTFLSDDTFDDKPIKVRGIFSPITPTSMQWEQAFSPDGGKTWETNWIMRYSRAG